MIVASLQFGFGLLYPKTTVTVPFPSELSVG